jgi:hypothetical protein
MRKRMGVVSEAAMADQDSIRVVKIRIPMQNQINK